MADRWMDERERSERERSERDRDDRDWRRQGHYSQDQYTQWTRGGGSGYGERRSFDDRDDRGRQYEGDGGYEGGRDKVFGEGGPGAEGGGERVFGERESGASYGGRTSYGGARGIGDRGMGGRGDGRPGWQNPEYGGVSPAMRRGGYGGRARFQGQDYTRPDIGRQFGGGAGGRYYGDDSREPIYREEWSQGGRDYGPAPRGYDAGYSETRERYHNQGYGEPGFGGPNYGGPSYGGYEGDMQRRASGGTGGYDYERGYGDGGRGDQRGERGSERNERTQRFEDAGRGAGDFLHRAGQRVAEWFGGGSEARAYDDRDRERERGAQRGRGPQGYKRSDDRISEDAHERLTDDGWLDASNISVSVSGGEVTLSGTVDNREAKHRAERIVEEISGVSHVQNNLRIAKAGFLRSDSTGYGDSVAEAQMRREDPAGTSTTGTGGGQSTAGKKN
ncbi:MAG: BON domain-containing protein [Phenylobacterium sp.]